MNFIPRRVNLTNARRCLRSIHVTDLQCASAGAIAHVKSPSERAPGDFARHHSFHAKDIDAGPCPPISILVSIEGNIGAGKSTLLSSLRDANPDWTFIEEPVGVWSNLENEEGQALLELFYADRRRWSYTFQNCALLTRFQNIEASIADRSMHTSLRGVHSQRAATVFITERCLDTDYEVFTKMLHEEGSIDKLEMDLYLRWFSQLQQDATPLAGLVMVDSTPDECLQRIRSRARGGEGGISLEYLQQLDAQHEKWLQSGQHPFLRIPNGSGAGAVETGVRQVQEFIRDLVARSLENA
jgi:deoxycitidine kinase